MARWLPCSRSYSRSGGRHSQGCRGRKSLSRPDKATSANQQHRLFHGAHATSSPAPPNHPTSPPRSPWHRHRCRRRCCCQAAVSGFSAPLPSLQSLQSLQSLHRPAPPERTRRKRGPAGCRAQSRSRPLRPGLSQHSHSTVTATAQPQPQHSHSIVTAQSQHNHSKIDNDVSPTTATGPVTACDPRRHV